MARITGLYLVILFYFNGLGDLLVLRIDEGADHHGPLKFV